MKYAVLIALTFVIGSTQLFAQVTGGAVNGSVFDANNAVIPDVTVKLTNKERGQVISVQTTESGSYIFPNVPVGAYTISIEKSGFATVKKELTVSLNQTITVDATLQVAGATNTVDVLSTNDAIVQTDNSQIGKSFEIRNVQDLPINGNPNNLALLSPNVVARTEGTAGSGGTVGGVRPRGNVFNVDGIDNNDAVVTGPSTGVIQDAVQEFTLLQNNYNAEFGSGAGGQFNTITRSGTNQFHGSAFTYINSQKLNARSTTEDGRDKDFLKNARYGGTFGGPIVKNKLFFFGAYERNYNDQATSPGVFFAPTQAGLNQIAAIPGVSQYVVNLLKNNLTLAPAADAAATAELGTVLGVSGIPFGEVILPVPGTFSQNSFQINVDHNPNEKDQFRYRFGFDRQRAEQAGSGALKFNNLYSFDSRLFSANWIRSFNSNFVNDLRLSLRKTVQDFPLKDSALNNFPNITVDSLNLVLGPNGVLPQGTPVDWSYQFYDALTYVRGNHTFKFGADIRRLINTSLFLPRARGDYEYSTLDQLLLDTQPDVVDIRGVGSATFEGDRFQHAYFGQDDWKIRPNLTLNLGLRYEYVTLPKGAATQALNNLSSVPGVIEFNRPKTDKNNFAPRLGFAWSPSGGDNWFSKFLFGNNGESSIRANFAVAHFVNFLNLLQLNLPPQFQQEINNGGPATQFLQSGGIPNVLAPVGTQTQARAATSSYIADQTVPVSYSFALSYQRQLSANTGIEFRYLHTSVRQLPIQIRRNTGRLTAGDFTMPTFYSMPSAAQLSGLRTLGQIGNNSATALTGDLQQYGFEQNVTAFDPIGKSNYDGGSISLTRRFTNNFGFTAAYTFSKTLDDSTNELNTSALNPRRPQDAFDIKNEYGLSALDIPHRFVVSFNYDLPFFKKDANPWKKALLGGWEFNGVFQAQSGQPITIRSGIDSNFNIDVAGDRAILNPNGTPGTSSTVCPIDSQGRFLRGSNSAFFSTGTVVTNINQCRLGFYGPTNAVAYLVVNPNAQYIQTGFFTNAATAGRNTFRTKGFNSTDLVIIKNSRFGREGRFNFQIGAEISDLFNQRPRTIYGVGSQTSAFGIAGNASFNDYSIGSFVGRQITMRAKFIF